MFCAWQAGFALKRTSSPYLVYFNADTDLQSALLWPSSENMPKCHRFPNEMQILNFLKFTDSILLLYCIWTVPMRHIRNKGLRFLTAKVFALATPQVSQLDGLWHLDDLKGLVQTKWFYNSTSHEEYEPPACLLSQRNAKKQWNTQSQVRLPFVICNCYYTDVTDAGAK